MEIRLAIDEARLPRNFRLRVAPVQLVVTVRVRRGAFVKLTQQVVGCERLAGEGSLGMRLRYFGEVVKRGGFSTWVCEKAEKILAILNG